MRLIATVAVLAIALAFVTGQAPRAEPASPIETVIQSQIGAFQRGDAAGAFRFASPGIQRRFGSPDVFMQMVESGYPQIRHPSSIAFLEATVQGGVTMQKARILGADGVAVTAVYAMVEIDGVWRIDGVWLLDEETSV